MIWSSSKEFYQERDRSRTIAVLSTYIAAYCDLKGLRLAEVFEDPGISGGKPFASRLEAATGANAA
jgi:hypothetical protein